MILRFGNVKGRSGEYAIGPVSVVVGDNFSGKSAILTAARLALIGYDPALGKTPGATWQLASGSEMSVALWKDKATNCRRTWSLVKGGVTTKVEQCSTWNIPAALVDVREFLGMPAKKRAEYILGLVPIPAASVGLETLVMSIAQDHRTSEVLEFLEFWDGERVERQQPVGPWLATLCEAAAVRARDAAASAKEGEAAVRQFVSEPLALGVQDRTQEIARVQAEISELTIAEGGHRKAQEAVAGANRLRLAVESVEHELTAQRATKAALHVTDADTTNAEKLEAELSESLRIANEDLARVQSQRKKLGRTGKCPTCGCEAVRLGTSMDKEIAKLGASIATMASHHCVAKAAAAQVVALRSIDERIKTLEANLAEMRTRQAETPAYDEAAHAEVSKSLSGKRHELGILTGQQAAWERAQGRKAVQARAEAQAASAAADAEVWRAVAYGLKAHRDHVVEQAFGTFADSIEQFTDGILPFQVAVHDGDLGYFKDGIWVSHEVFSGSEMAMVYAGLGVALAGNASVKIVMMDEVLISHENKRKIADRMLALAKAGVIDAFLIVDVDEAGWPTWCDVIRTGEGVPA